MLAALRNLPRDNLATFSDVSTDTYSSMTAVLNNKHFDKLRDYFLTADFLGFGIRIICSHAHLSGIILYVRTPGVLYEYCI